jgi:hypothetical protein
MRILLPADADHELPVKPFAGGVDSKMVWNPCAKETQIAIAPEIPPVRNDRLMTGPWPTPCFPVLGTADKHPEPGAAWFAPPSFHLASGLAPTLNRTPTCRKERTQTIWTGALRK